MRSIVAIAAAAGLLAGMAGVAPAVAKPCHGLTGAHAPRGCVARRAYNEPDRRRHARMVLSYNHGYSTEYNNGFNPSLYHDYGYYPPEGSYPSGGFDYGSPGGTFLGVPGYHGDF